MLVLPDHVFWHLARVIVADAIRCEFKRVALVPGHVGDCRLDLLTGKGEGLGRQRQAVKPLGQLDDIGPLCLANPHHDVGHIIKDKR